MAFSSVQFLFVFLPLALAVYWLCPKRLRNAVLGAFSLLFFAWAGLKGAAILVLLAGINWLGGLSLGRLAHKRPLLTALVLLDLEKEQQYWEAVTGWRLKIEEESSPDIAA